MNQQELKEQAAMWGMEMNVALPFAESLRAHIRFVQEAGRRIGVPERQLMIHDDSKWSSWEFPHYARNFFGDKKDPEGFAVAWLHHQNFNPHHWEYWITRSDHSRGGSRAEDGCLPMPRSYALEMVADWMGASMAYTGSWDMRDWLAKNLPRIRIHSAAALYLHEILTAHGYKDVWDHATTS